MKKLPKKTLTRTLVYIRTLDQLLKKQENYISSKQLSELTGFSDVQIRKDISNFGKVGRPRIGYDIKELKKVLESYTLDTAIQAVLFGVGNLGKAILKYSGFKRDKISFVAAFDNNEDKIGTVSSGVTVYNVKDAKQIVEERNAKIAVITAPAIYAQKIADAIVASGLKGILNFSPTTIMVPENVTVRDIDITIEFLALFNTMDNI